MPVWRGAIHLHTSYSHDGTLRPAELCEFLRTRGYQFAAVTDHSQDLDVRSVAQLAEECQRLSSAEFLMIPGIEFECESRIHLLGLGVTALCDGQDPAAVVDHIHRQGGLAVLAHPSQRQYPLHPDWLRQLDGCEIWNNRQGKWLPQLAATNKFEELAAQAPGLRAVAGLDLHHPDGFSAVHFAVECAGLTWSDVRDAILQRRYITGSPWLRLTAAGDLGRWARWYLRTARSGLNLVRTARNKLT